MQPASSTRSAASTTGAHRPTRSPSSASAASPSGPPSSRSSIDDVTVNLIDTPGHPDFIAEVERVLHVLDGAVLVVSAVEGVQAQTRILMRTLQRLRIPTLIFVNKIDRGGATEDGVLRDMADKLSPATIAMGTTREIGTRGAVFAPYDPADVEFRSKLAPCSPSTTRKSSPRYVDGDSAVGGPTRARVGGADRPRPRSPGVLRLSDHGRRRGSADARDRTAAPGGRGRRRQRALGHRVQDRARSGRREGRLRPTLLGNPANARQGLLPW